MEIRPQDAIGLTILKAILEMGGTSTTPNLRKHMDITVSNNFAGWLTDLYGKQYLLKKKHPNSKTGVMKNIWSISGTGKTHLQKYKKHCISYAEVSEYLTLRFEETKRRKIERSHGTPPKVSKSVGQAMDSIATLIEENQKRDVLLRSMRSMIDAVLDNQEEE